MDDGKVIIPLGFNIDFESVTKEWEAKKQSLQANLSLEVGVRVSKINVDSLKAVKDALKDLKLEPVTPETKEAISSLIAELRSLETILVKIDSLNRSRGAEWAATTKKEALAAKALTDAKWAEERLAGQQAKTKSSILQLDGQISSQEQKAALAKINAYAASERAQTQEVKKQSAILKMSEQTAAMEQKATIAKINAQLVSERLANQEVKTKSSLLKLTGQAATQEQKAIQAKLNAQLSSERIATQEARTKATLIQMTGQLAAQEQKAAVAKINVQAAEQRLNAARQTSIGTINAQNKALISQGMALNGLKQFAMQYLSILGAWRLFEGIRKTTADFELQRVVLQAMIRDRQAADKIFGQTLKLAIESPFTAQELITYTKQLAAYRIETDKLHDTTRRLADVSAGLGVDMSRLILAYGQVRAASVLRGQEIRQFTEAGVPLVELLADKFSELKNRVVETSEVFDLVSKRQVPFAMVAEVFEDMTNKGGMFYNMQQIQADTLYGIYRKLGDNISQAFYQIGESNMVMFKGLGEALIVVARNLETILKAGEAGIAMWAIYRLGLKYNTVALGAENAGLIKSVMAKKAQQAETLRQASTYGRLTMAQARQLAMSTQLTAADIKAMGYEGPMVKNLIARAFWTKKLSDEQLKAAVTIGLLEKGQDKAIKSMTTGQVYALKFGSAVRSVGAAFKNLWTTMIANPTTWVLAAISGIIFGVSKLISHNNELKKSIKAISDSSKESLGDIRDMYERLAEKFDAKELMGVGSPERLSEVMSEMRRILNTSESLKKLTKERLKGVTDEAKQFAIIKQLMDEYQASLRMSAANPSRFIEANKSTYIWGDSFKRDAMQFDEVISDMGSKLNGLQKMYPESSQISGWNKEWIRLNETQATYIEKMAFIKKMQDEVNASPQRNYSYVQLGTDIGNVSDKYKDAIKQGEVFSKYLKNLYKDVDGQEIKWDEKNYGLSEKNLSLLTTSILNEQEKWFNGFSDKFKDGIPVIREVMQQYFTDIPITFSIEPPKDVEPLKDWWNLFAKVQGKAKGTGTNLFNETEIRGMNDQVTAAKKLNEKWNERKALIKQENDYLKERKTITASTVEDENIENGELIAASEARIVTYQNELDAIEAIAKALGISLTLTKKNGGGSKDTRQSELLAEVAAVKEAYKRYEELTTRMSRLSAADMMKNEYADVVASFKYLPKTTPTSPKDLIKTIQAALTQGQAYLDGKGKLQLRMDIADTAFDEAKRKIDKQLSDLNKDIDRQISANNFFDKMMKMTGNVDIATKFTMDTTGLKVQDVSDKLKEAISTAMASADTGEVFNLDDYKKKSGYLDIAKLQAKINTFPDKAKEAAQSALNAFQKHQQDIIAGLYQTLDKYDSYASRIQREKDQAASDIKGVKQTDATPAMIADFEKARDKKMNRNIYGIELEEIKNMDDYIKAFENLDKVGTMTLNDLKGVLEAYLMRARESLDPTQIREVVKQIEKLDDTMNARQPFSSAIDGFKEWRNAVKELPELEEKMNQSKTNVSEKSEALSNARWFYEISEGTDAALGAMFALEVAQDEYNDAVAESGVATTNFKNGQNAAKEAIAKIIKGLAESKKQFDTLTSVVTGTVDVISQVVEGLGGAFDEDTQEIIDNFAKAVQVVSAAMGVMSVVMQVATIAAEGLEAALLPLLIAAVALTVLFTIFGGKQKRIEKQMARSELEVKKLENAYKALERTMDAMAGEKRYAVMGKKLQNMSEQYFGLLHQQQLEASKGKKKDEGRMEDLGQSAREMLWKMEDLITEFKEDFMGGSFRDFADELSSAMFDALADGRKVAIEAWDTAVDEILANMVRKFLVTKFLEEPMQGILDAWWKEAGGIESSMASDKIKLEQELANYKKNNVFLSVLGGKEDIKLFNDQITEYERQIAEMQKAIDEGIKGPQLNDDNIGDLQDKLYQLGDWFNDKVLGSGLGDILAGKGESNLTGISKAVGSLTEDTALTLAAVANSMLYYQVGAYNMQFNMNDILTRWDLSFMGGSEGVGFIPSMIAYQTRAMAVMEAIKNDTGRIAVATEGVAENLKSVMSPLGVKVGANAINVNS